MEEVKDIVLPKSFVEYTKSLFGAELFKIFAEGLKETAPVSIRLNRFKVKESIRPNEQFCPQPIPWCNEGYWLDKRPNFTFDPLLHAGAYYVQEASSMFIAHVLKQCINKPVLALDLCAAPGGKTTCARNILPEGSLLLSNEPIGKRAQILAENVQKFGKEDILVTNNYPKHYKKTKLAFDLIIADVPCSGEGMFRKDPQTINEWSEQNVENCSELQRSIIEEVWENLKPGGFLVYSTCTFNAHENEENIAWIAKTLGADLVHIPTEKDWNITGSLVGNPLDNTDDFPVYRFIPGKTKGEGLFLAVLKKWDKENEFNSYGLYEIDKVLVEVKKHLKVLTYGINEGTMKGKTFIPDHSQALAVNADLSKYQRVEVDYKTAISYLRREAINLPKETERGLVIITYKGFALGFAKNLGNRANNLYPQEWRIKSTHVPSSYEEVLENITK